MSWINVNRHRTVRRGTGSNPNRHGDADSLEQKGKTASRRQGGSNTTEEGGSTAPPRSKLQWAELCSSNTFAADADGDERAG